MRDEDWECVGRSCVGGWCGSERAQAPGGAPMARDVYWLRLVGSRYGETISRTSVGFESMRVGWTG